VTGQRETTRYAVPSVSRRTANWGVEAHPWGEFVGVVEEAGTVGWTAATPTARPLGLWPTKQAAAEVLVKQAGYELETT
jgi:hypothetical protein